MMKKNYLIIFFSLLMMSLFGQKKDTKKEAPKFEIIKPLSFKNVQLPAEVSSTKKYTFLRKFYNNTTARYNYVYNCERLLSLMVDSAKTVYKENYLEKPISFYNYDIEFIAKNFQKETDSILNKTTAGILLHDLRNRWVDDLYLKMGMAYYFKKNYDSALLMFQYVNYQYEDKVVAKSYINDAGVSKRIIAPTIVNRESKNKWLNFFSPPEQARNDALIWIIKTYIAKNELADASVLIDALNKDIFFPERLRPFFYETQALFYYQQKQYLSAAQYLALTFSLCKDRQEKARRCFLISQLYNLSEREDLATQYLRDAIKYTYDPVLEIYSRLNYVLQVRHPNEYVINEHIDNMLKLVKKERFKRYKDLIYFACSFMALKKNNVEEATSYIQLSSQYTELSNTPERDNIYFQFFKLLWVKKQYAKSAVALDSISNEFIDQDNTFFLKLRDLHPALKKFAVIYNTYHKEDSLVLISRLDSVSFNVWLEKRVKENEKAMQLIINQKKIQSILGKTLVNGSWYFDNKEVVQNGALQFQNLWNNRKNVDNWRRKSNFSNAMMNANGLNNQDTFYHISYKEMVDKIRSELPLDDARKKRSDSILFEGLMRLAEIYYIDFKDYELAEKTYFDIIKKHYDRVNEDVFLNLYFIYKEVKNENKNVKLSQLRQDYLLKFPQGKYVVLFENQHVPNHQEDSLYEEIVRCYNQTNCASIENNYQIFGRLFTKVEYQLKSQFLLGIYYLKRHQNANAKEVLSDLDAKLQGQSQVAMYEELRARTLFYLSKLE